MTSPDPGPAPKKPALGTGFIIIGSELVSAALAGVVLDYALGTMPWCTVGLTLLGFLGAIALTLRLLRQEDAHNRANPPGAR